MEKFSPVSPYTILHIDAVGRVRQAIVTSETFKDPTPYDAREAWFEAETAPRANPKRLAAGWRVTREAEAVDPESGLPITIEEPVDWTDCIMDGFDVREMTEAEKADRDAYYAAQKEAQEEAAQAAKTQEIKNMELKAKTILETAGITFPIAEANKFTDILAVWQNVHTAIDNIGDLAGAKAFLKKLAKVILAFRLLDSLNPYAPKFGDGGEE